MPKITHFKKKRGMAWSRGIFSEPDYLNQVAGLKFATFGPSATCVGQYLGSNFLRFWNLGTICYKIWVVRNCPVGSKIFHFSIQNSNLGQFSIFARPAGMASRDFAAIFCIWPFFDTVYRSIVVWYRNYYARSCHALVSSPRIHL